MLVVRIRACHVHGRFPAKDNSRPSFTLRDALENPRRQVDRIVLPPASYLHEREKIEKRWPAAVKFVTDNRLNEFFDGDLTDIGVVMQGGMYNTTLRALERLGLADACSAAVEGSALRAQRDLSADRFRSVVRFCAGQARHPGGRRLKVKPEFLEQAINTILRRADVQTTVEGKSMLPMAGEYTGGVVHEVCARSSSVMACSSAAGQASRADVLAAMSVHPPLPSNEAATRLAACRQGDRAAG